MSIVSSYAAGASIIFLLFFLDRPNAINYINQYAFEISDPRFADPVSRILWVLFAQQYGAVSGIADSVFSFGWLSGMAQVFRKAWSENPALLVVGGIGLISGLAGWKTRSGQGPFFGFVGVTAAVNILYFATYMRFFEPIFLIHIYLALAVGMAYFLGRTIHSGRGRCLVALLIVAIALNQLIAHFGSIDKHGTEIYGLETERFLGSIERDAVVFSTWGNSTLMWYVQWVEGRHRDVTVVNAMPHSWPRLAGRFAGRPLYFESIPPGQPETSFAPALHYFRFVERRPPFR